MINTTIVQGRLARDPEVKQTQSGVSYATFTVCWSSKYKETETKLFMPCKAWRGTADMLAKYFHKGSELIAEGRIITEEWEKDGEKKSRLLMDVQNVHFCGKKSDGEQAGTTPEAQSQPIAVDDEPLPF